MAIGGRPPAVVGFANVTGTGAPLIVEAVIDGGHVIVSDGDPGVGGLGGGVGSVGDEHPAVSEHQRYEPCPEQPLDSRPDGHRHCQHFTMCSLGFISGEAPPQITEQT